MKYLVTPLLYAEVAEIGSVKRLPLFLRTILEKPDLAQHVKSISGCSFQRKNYFVNSRDNKDIWAYRVIDISVWSLQDKFVVQKAVDTATASLNLAYYSYPERPDMNFVDRWSRRLLNTSSRSTWDATVALLLCHLPNLETFRIDSYNDDRHHAHDGLRGFEFIVRVLKSSKVGSERVSIIVRYRDPMDRMNYDACRDRDGYISAHGGFHTLGSLSGFRKLRCLRVSAQILIGNPSLNNRYFSTLSDDEISQAAVYTPPQEEAFYRHLPKAIEVLIIIDCPNAMYGCIKRFLQSAHVPPKPKRIELAYTA
jgi:hypothetical protein